MILIYEKPLLVGTVTFSGTTNTKQLFVISWKIVIYLLLALNKAKLQYDTQRRGSLNIHSVNKLRK